MQNFYSNQPLYYLESVQSSCRVLLFFLSILPWFYVCFDVLLCSGSSCTGDAYSAAKNIMWNMSLCLTLFSLANFLKALLAKLLSTQFYK